MIEFNKVSNESYFIKNLLYSTFLPLVRTVRENDYIIRDRLYIYKCNIIRCTSSGYIPVKNTNLDVSQYPKSLLRKTDDEKIRVGQVYYALVGDSVKRIIGGRGDNRSPIAEGWYEENIASYDILGEYYFGERNDKFCRNFLSSSEGYDYRTHEKLGQYLRSLRDMYGLNLLPLYNCFSNQLLRNIHITNSSVERASADYSTKVYKVPIRFNTDYTICMDNVGMTTFAPAFIHHGTLLKLNNNRFGNGLDATNKYIKLNHNDVIHNCPDLRFKNPIKLRFDNVPRNKVVNYSEVTYTEIPAKYTPKYFRLNSSANPAYVKKQVADAYMSIDYNNPQLEGHPVYAEGYEFYILGESESGLVPDETLFPDDDLILPAGGFKVANITEDDFLGNEENYFLYDNSTHAFVQCQSGDTFDEDATYFYRSEVYQSINPSIGTFDDVCKSYKKCPEDETFFNRTIFNANKTKYYTISNIVTPGETVTNTGDVASFNSTTNETCEKLVASIEPSQDLHGYDAPWVGGAGKNKLDFSDITGVGWADSVPFAPIVDFINALPVGDYVLSFEGIVTSIDTTKWTSDTATATVIRGLLVWDGGSAYTSANGYATAVTRPNALNFYARRVLPFSITESNKGKFTRLYMYGVGRDSATEGALNGTLGLATFSKFQLESGSTATSWTPYENICPISGHDSVDVEHTGKNLLDPTNAFGSFSGYTVNADGSVTVAEADSRVWTGIAPIPLKAGTYTLSRDVTDGRTAIRTSDNNYGSDTVIFAGQTSISFTLAQDGGIKVKANYSGTYPITIKLQLEKGTTATTYEPYNGQTYTTQLGQTVYGGTLDLVSGELTTTHVLKQLDYMSSWMFENAAAGKNFYINLGEDVKAQQWNVTEGFATNVAEPSSVMGSQLNKCFISASKNFNWTCGDTLGLSSAQELKNYLQQNNITVQVCAELATPTTIQLTPQQIELLLGTNNIWADSGDIEITHTPYTNNIIYVQCTSSTVYDEDEVYYYVDKQKDEGWYEFVGNQFVKTQDTYIDLTKTYYKKDMTEVPMTYNYDITEDNCCMYDYIEDELYLLIQVPSVFNSNIVILEGDYTEDVQEKLYDVGKFEVFSNSKLDYLFTKDLILMETNTKSLRPFSPTLIQFLLWNAICNLDTINNDFDRLSIALDGITTLVGNPQFNHNYWYDKYREAIFDYAKEFPRKYVRDNLGYVTRDIERIIYQGQEFIDSPDESDYPDEEEY